MEEIGATSIATGNTLHVPKLRLYLDKYGI
jgi:hypothetical protein